MSRAQFPFAMGEVDLTHARSALNVMIDAYTEMAQKEKNAADRQDLLNYRAKADAMLTRFKVLPLQPGEHDTFNLTPGDLSVFERALRMSMAKWQQMIRVDMTAEQKKAIRDSADDVGALLTRLRKERGLPW